MICTSMLRQFCASPDQVALNGRLAWATRPIYLPELDATLATDQGALVLVPGRHVFSFTLKPEGKALQPPGFLGVVGALAEAARRLDSSHAPALPSWLAAPRFEAHRMPVVSWAGKRFCGVLMRRIAGLPDVRFGVGRVMTQGAWHERGFFQFTGGIGAVSPLADFQF